METRECSFDVCEKIDKVSPASAAPLLASQCQVRAARPRRIISMSEKSSFNRKKFSYEQDRFHLDQMIRYMPNHILISLHHQICNVCVEGVPEVFIRTVEDLYVVKGVILGTTKIYGEKLKVKLTEDGWIHAECAPPNPRRKEN